ncbi:MAG: hypothetical protein COT89_02435 [Candidatus Colwellbacteria bacterium CG10_big_fil_rev_8_21_14_0_10_42_22]|uniref:Uncharacterized protein n=1 Tax=Candidatus Colwellbacteria bacterium CG10_big_fil_rev_8_21_14_0_10_42_22 TaxID=1974540 RepID=A0A2H0VFM6_9BACT|nr:MAG: hypothetical protein COT89_02435 [Candidatus Colwellbacteria bacterium CG10_big_fil_rev_8_21_14_0_10_42_22]
MNPTFVKSGGIHADGVVGLALDAPSDSGKREASVVLMAPLGAVVDRKANFAALLRANASRGIHLVFAVASADSSRNCRIATRSRSSKIASHSLVLKERHLFPPYPDALDP